MGRPTSSKSSRRTFLKIAGASAAMAFPGLPSLATAARGTNTPGADTHHHDPALLRPRREKAGIISPQKTYRMMEWEFHTPPEERFNIDIDGAMHAARDAGAEAVRFYTQDHRGYAYYPSDVAVRHPHLDRDLFGTEVALAHKLGMPACTYYCLQFNNQSVLV